MIEPYHFIACTLEQFVQLKETGLDLGGPRAGPDGRLLSNLNGCQPLSEDQKALCESLGAEVVPSVRIDQWLLDNGWLANQGSDV